MRGPSPAPTAIRLVKGNPQRKPINRREPKFREAADLSPPEILGALATKYWQKYAPMLRDAGVLTEGDRETLAALCLCLARRDDAQAIVDREGLTATSSQGSRMTHPAVRILQTAIDQQRGLSQELGLTPSARTRIKVENDGEKDDPTAKYFAR